MPGTVIEVSATLVASTTRRRAPVRNTLSWSATLNREYKGKTSKPFICASRSFFAVSRISLSPLRKIKISRAFGEAGALCRQAFTASSM